MKDSLKAVGLMLYAFVANLYIEWHNRRLEKKRRTWTAHKMGGGGVVPLGHVDMETAIDKATRFGTIHYVDVEAAVVMYGDKL